MNLCNVIVHEHIKLPKGDFFRHKTKRKNFKKEFLFHGFTFPIRPQLGQVILALFGLPRSNIPAFPFSSVRPNPQNYTAALVSLQIK
jgi:hypothetical protein